MVEWFRAAVPACRGLVAAVVGHGVTEDYDWSATPALLVADLKRAGFRLRCPSLFERVGIAGSGGPDWLRHDYEFIVCVTGCAGELPAQLPWSNNVALGHPPKWGPGGEFSHRVPSGRKVNQWGGNAAGMGQARPNGKRQQKARPGHKVSRVGKKVNVCGPDGERMEQTYVPPTLANPGNDVQARYTAEEVEGFLERYEQGMVRHCKVGGGNMGHKLAHKNEAPFPVSLAEFFVLSFCPPGGVVYDGFCGSGTTVHAAVENRRRGLGTDVRQGQVKWARERIASVTPKFFVPSDEHKAAVEAAKEAVPQEDRPEDGLQGGGDPAGAGAEGGLLPFPDPGE
jgi:hypothetical protein